MIKSQQFGTILAQHTIIMKQSKKQNRSLTFRRYSRKAYALFSSLGREVRIGVLSVAMLGGTSLQQALAQQPQAMQSADGETTEVELSEVDVIGSRAPLSQGLTSRQVNLITAKKVETAPAHSVNDLLKNAVGIDVRQRGEMGIQTDISIHGGTFDQICILLNGVNISNPHTGHLAADFPVNTHDIERIEIVEGAAARLFGTSAFSGAINIVTKTDSVPHASASIRGGSYGTFGATAAANYSTSNADNRLSVGYNRSDGARQNSDFDRLNAFYSSHLGTNLANFDIQAGFSNQKYGANTFYSAAYPNQWEANRRILVSAKAETKGRIHFSPGVYWNRSTDHFQLIRNTHTAENFHRTDVYGLNLNAHFDWLAGRTAIGSEFRNEGILSTNLGRPLDSTKFVSIYGEDQRKYTCKDNRTNISIYAEHNILLQKFTISLGAVANMNSALDNKLNIYPGVDVAYRPTDAWRIYANWNMALRMPTFTDLYYKSPTNQGNVGLKPEETSTAQIGARWLGSNISAQVQGFWCEGRNMIDWVMYNENDIFHSTGFELTNCGIETNVNINLRKWCGLQSIGLGYTFINQTRHDDQKIYKSNYALEYLRHKFVGTLNHQIWRNLTAEWSVRWQQRMGSYIKYDNGKSTGQLVDYKPYALLDLKLQWQEKRVNFYAECTNLTNKLYYDYGNIPQPGIQAFAGVEIKF